MKNPFRRRQTELDNQLTLMRELSATMAEMSQRIEYETSLPVLRHKLQELDPRLVDLMQYFADKEIVSGSNDLGSGLRKRSVDACRYAFDNDVQIANATKTWTDWGFGRNLSIKAVDQAADEVWQECWTAARNRALFGQSVIHELSEAVLTDGELFFVGYASQQDGAVTWRTFDTKAITKIIHPKNDQHVNVWYVVQLEGKQVAIPDAFTYYALRDRFEGVKLPQGVKNINETADALSNGGTFTVMVSAQRNRDKDGRGWPEFHKALSWSSVYSQMLKEYSAVFSAVAMYVDKLKVQGGSRTVTDVISALQSSLATTAGSYLDTNPRPAAGSAWADNDATDRTRMPLGSAAGDAQTGTLTVGTQLATALRVKLSDIGRPDAFQNKATADIAAESPQQAWQRYQLFWTSVWSDIVETTLRLKEQFDKVAFKSYASEVSTSLPMDIDTETITMAMKAVNDSAAGGTLNYGVATRANTALTGLLLLDLGIDDVDAILEVPNASELAAVVFENRSRGLIDRGTYVNFLLAELEEQTLE